VVLDAGCGPGWHAPVLAGAATSVVLLDGARAMLRLAVAEVPGAPAVQADLAALPLRDRSLAGALGSRSYVHLDRRQVPAALAQLHRALRPGAPVTLVLFDGDQDHAAFADDTYPGRLFSRWPVPLLHDVLAGAGFADVAVRREAPRAGGVADLVVTATRALTLPDTVGPDLRLLVCGLNPSVLAAERGIPFVRPGNRFWPAALAAGIATRDRDPAHALRAHGLGMTDLVKRATPRAAELRVDEYRAGVARVERLVAWLQPAAVCLVGLAGWRAAGHRRAVPGWQPEPFGARPLYLMPNTSGLNASSSLADLTDHLRAVRRGPR
jgi:double-stranded uracil-DNA glycosylase